MQQQLVLFPVSVATAMAQGCEVLPARNRPCARDGLEVAPCKVRKCRIAATRVASRVLWDDAVVSLLEWSRRFARKQMPARYITPYFAKTTH